MVRRVVLAFVVLAVLAVGYGMLHGTAPGAAVPAGGYTYQVPKGVADQLAGQVSGYRSCTGEGGCLRSVAHPDQRGDLQVRISGTRAVALLCLRADRVDVERGCDVVWNSVQLRPPAG